VKSALFGNSLTVIIDDGRLELGMFQSIFLCEFAGPRKRKVLMKIMEG
jgi:secondary thiamine-phosphate synthase enzyme